MNISLKKIIVFLLIIASGCVVANIAHAAPTVDDYTVLAPLPGTTGCNPGDITSGDYTCQTDFSTYLPGAFNLTIGIAAALAFLVISYGGFLYMTSDAIMKKQDGRKYIENALKGLILVLGAYALLNTINPQILHFNLSVQNPSINIPSGVNVITPLDSTQAAASDAMKAKLITDTGGAIQVYKGPCVNGSTSGCVNLNGLTDPTVAGLENLVKCAGCTINISGGTEGGHSVGSAHNNGNAVDFSASPQVNAAITSNYSGGLVPGRTYSYNGGRYLWEPAGCLCGGTVASTGDHWHVTYP